MNPIARWLGARLGRYLARRRRTQTSAVPTALSALEACLQPGDVLLVEGHSRVSTAIKYLTQSTWSHAALYVGQEPAAARTRTEAHRFIEADIVEGVRSVGLSEYAGLHMRICRPVGLSPEELQAVIGYARARLGHHYDLKNVFDLARYLLPTPPVPLRWRRRMLALGSGDPTRAICSTLIAQAFQSVRYPILPTIEARPSNNPWCPACVDEILHVRHHSLFAPRDFDVSPYFQVVKPTLEAGFDPHQLTWHDGGSTSAARPATPHHAAGV